jgi:hypothetical protein
VQIRPLDLGTAASSAQKEERVELQDWKVVHLHFSVGVPDEQAIKPPPTRGAVFTAHAR